MAAESLQQPLFVRGRGGTIDLQRSARGDFIVLLLVPAKIGAGVSSCYFRADSAAPFTQAIHACFNTFGRRIHHFELTGRYSAISGQIRQVERHVIALNFVPIQAIWSSADRFTMVLQRDQLSRITSYCY